MFTVKNSLITSSKTIDIGKERSVTLSFQFEDVTFEDTDILELQYGENLTSTTYSFTNSGLVKFVNVNFDFISSSSTSVAVKIIKNSTEILSDTITVSAQIEGGEIDLSNYVQFQDMSSALSSYVETSYLSSTLSDYVTNSYLSSQLSNYATVSDIGDINSVLDEINGTVI